MTIKVIELNKSNLQKFNNDVMKPQPQIIMFTAPWCGHCQNLKSELPSVLQNVKNMSGNGMLAMVDEEYIPEVKCDNKVEGYPSIDFMVGGHKRGSYNGPRDAAHLTNYIKEKLGGKQQKPKRKRRKTKKKSKKRKSRRRRRTRRKRKKIKSRRRKMKKSLKERFLKTLIG